MTTEAQNHDQTTTTQPVPVAKMFSILSFLFLGCLLQGSTYSHLTSFFNKFALSEKHLTSGQYGIIMGSYCLSVAIVTPFAAKLVTMRTFLDKTIMIFGWTVDAIFCIIMAFVNSVKGGYLFFVASLIVRTLEAIGCAIGFFMLYVIIGAELSEINHIIIPIMETMYGVAVVIGPAAGGILYDYGGFRMPFFVFGGLLFGVTLLAMMFFPKPRIVSTEESQMKPPSIRSVIKPAIIVNVLCSLNAFTLIPFNESTLALRLNEKFAMTASECGVIFLCVGGMYALSSLLLGYLSKRVTDPRYLVLLGQCFILLGLILQAPLIEINQTTNVIYVAQMVFGFGSGPAFVCSYLHSLKYLANGKETKQTYAVLSAIFTPITSIGATIGPLIAGLILDYYSYETVVFFYTIQTVFVTFCLILSMFIHR